MVGWSARVDPIRAKTASEQMLLGAGVHFTQFGQRSKVCIVSHMQSVGVASRMVLPHIGLSQSSHNAGMPWFCCLFSNAANTAKSSLMRISSTCSTLLLINRSSAWMASSLLLGVVPGSRWLAPGVEEGWR